MSFKFGSRRASDITAGTFDIAAASVTQHEAALESALDLNELNVAGNTAIGANKITTTDVTVSNYSSSPTALVPYSVVADLIESQIGGLDWQQSVKDQLTAVQLAALSSPSDFDRYLIADDSSTHANKIAEYDSEAEAFNYQAPNAGMTVYIEDVDLLFVYKDDSTKWTNIGNFMSRSVVMFKPLTRNLVTLRALLRLMARSSSVTVPTSPLRVDRMLGQALVWVRWLLKRLTV